MTTKQCSKCRIVKSFDNFNNNKGKKGGKRSQCKACDNQYSKRYKQKNREHHKEYNKKYKQENREVLKKYAEKYYRKNKEYYKEHTKKYYRKNKEYYKEHNKKYKHKNSDKFNQYEAKRNALKRDTAVGIVDYAEIKRRDKMNCYLCKNDIVDDDYHFDHVYPLSKGGEHSMNNIKVTHARCNLVKNDRIIDEQQRGVK